MKKIATILILLLMVIDAFAQTSTNFKFLGIPVDGKKDDVITALKGKGFEYDAENGALTGKFNGVLSNVFVSENNGKVDRIYVCDATTQDAAGIINRYNILLQQFKDNDEKYYSLDEQNEIPTNENISYEMKIHNKLYDASFYFNPTYNNDEMANTITEAALKEIKERYDEEVLANANEETAQQMLQLTVAKKLVEMTEGHVWFRIVEYSGKYYIAIFYDNLKNRPNGEDL